MVVYPRALVARHIYARAVAAWPSAEPTDKPPGRYPRCPRLQRDGTACHRAPPSRYPRALPRALADTRVPCPSRYRAGQPSARALAIAACQPPDPLAVIGQPRTIAAEPSRRTGQTLGNPTQTEHPFDLLDPNRTPVRTNTCSNAHPVKLGKVTGITDYRFHSPKEF